jgi:hypothetical protein
VEGPAVFSIQQPIQPESHFPRVIPKEVEGSARFRDAWSQHSLVQ